MSKESTLVIPSRREIILGLIYLPFYVYLLSALLTFLIIKFNLPYSTIGINVTYQLVGFLYMVLFMSRYLKESFSRFLEFGIANLPVMLKGCAIRIITSFLLLAVPDLDSPNNEAVLEMARSSILSTIAMSVLLAPLLEECIFRGVIFAPLAKCSRLLGYAVSSIAFAFLHILSFVFIDFSPALFLVMLIYIPPGIALCWVYEKSGSIWTSIFLHMLMNLVALLLTA